MKRIFLVVPSLLVWSMLGRGQSGQIPAAPVADDRVTLHSLRKAYLLGEPVLLNLRARNESQKTIEILQVFVEPNTYEVPLWIAYDGNRFEEFLPNSTITKRDRRWISLEPGDRLEYKYRTVAKWDPHFQLAFPRPGEYHVYAMYPLSTRGGVGVMHIASNIVTVQITEPRRTDAKVWQRLNNAETLTFLQADSELTERDKIVALKITNILRVFPETGYASALQYALAKVSPRFRDSLTFEEATQFGQTLKIKGFARVEQNPADKRLDSIRKGSFEKGITVELLLRALSKASGVPLDSSPQFKERTIRMADSIATVRSCMHTLGVLLDGKWELRGETYYLVPSTDVSRR